MLYIAVDLLTGRRLEGFRGNTRPPQSFGTVPEGSRIVRTSSLSSSGVSRGNACVYGRGEHVKRVMSIIRSVIKRIRFAT